MLYELLISDGLMEVFWVPPGTRGHTVRTAAPCYNMTQPESKTFYTTADLEESFATPLRVLELQVLALKVH